MTSPSATRSDPPNGDSFEHARGATIRAISRRVELHFRNGVLYGRDGPIHAPTPYLHPPVGSDLKSFRGAADALALRALHSDTGEHVRLRPPEEVPALVFELLEQFRVESLRDDAHVGVAANIEHLFQDWLDRFHASGLTETSVGLLMFAISHVCRARVTGRSVGQNHEDIIEAVRFALAPLIGADLAALRTLRHDQPAYAVTALRIAAAIARLAGAQASITTPPRRARDIPFTLGLHDPVLEGGDPSSPATRGPHSGSTGGYSVFTTAWDREQPMAKITRREPLLDYRRELDAVIAGAGLKVATLTRQWRALGGRWKTTGWNPAQEEGLLDPARLTRLVTTPTDHNLFRTPWKEPDSDLQVTFLLDCSGSMRGRRQATTALVDVLVRSLDLADIDSEVLAFTTGSWNGGRARRDWLRARRPTNPGRLNERLHIVVKDFHTPWRRARPALAGLLRPDLYRESLDGEAVEWAASRAVEHCGATRPILLVLSDGSPMDAATSLANGPSYLDHHLAAVIDRITRDGRVAVTGVGVGESLLRHYPHAYSLALDAGIDQGLLRRAGDIVIQTYRRRSRW